MSFSPAPSATAATYLPALTGVRAVAAYLVFLHHFNPFPAHGPALGLHNVVRELHIGVPVFFVLSGFLITLRYAEHTRWTGRWWRQYLHNRLARIYPMYFLVTGLTFAGLYGAEGRIDVTVLLANLLLVRGFFEELAYSGIAQGWTLTVEECFYLAAPVAFWLLAQRKVPLWVLPFLLLGGGCLLVLICRPFALYGLFANLRFMLLFTFFGRGFEFFAGLQLALWYRQDRLRRYRIPGLLTGTGCLVIAVVLLGMVGVRGPYEYGQEHPFGIVLNNVVLPGGILLLFAGLLTETTWLRRLLASTPLQVLGKSSYIFYLIHVGVIQQFLRAHIVLPNDLLGFGIVFLLLNLLAIALYHLVEQPLNRLLRHHPARPETWSAPAPPL